jgi:hypothetical protein
MVRRPRSGVDVYWETHERITREPGCKRLLKQLTIVPIETWRLKQRAHAAQRRQREAKNKAERIRRLALVLAELRIGRQPYHLDWAAQLYFEDEERRRGRTTGVQRIIEATDQVIAGAVASLLRKPPLRRKRR